MLTTKGKVFVGATVQYSADGTTYKPAGQFKSYTGNKDVFDKIDLTVSESSFNEYVVGSHDLGDFAFTAVLSFDEIPTVKTDVFGKNNIKVKFTLKDGSSVIVEGFVSEFDAIGSGDFKTGTQVASCTITLQAEPIYDEAGA